MRRVTALGEASVSSWVTTEEGVFVVNNKTFPQGVCLLLLMASRTFL